MRRLVMLLILLASSLAAWCQQLEDVIGVGNAIISNNSITYAKNIFAKMNANLVEALPGVYLYQEGEDSSLLMVSVQKSSSGGVARIFFHCGSDYGSAAKEALSKEGYKYIKTEKDKDYNVLLDKYSNGTHSCTVAKTGKGGHTIIFE